MQIDIVQIVGLGLIATFLSLIVKEQKPTFAFLIVVFAGCAIFLYLVDQIYDIIRMIEKIAINANVNMVYVETILKIIGIAYIAEFGAQLTKDAGQGALPRNRIGWENFNSRYGCAYFNRHYRNDSRAYTFYVITERRR